MHIEAIDDLPLLYSQIEKFQIPQLINHHLPDHGNWSGASGGIVISGWLLYILSESDHRLSRVEDWAASRLSVLRTVLAYPTLRSLDFADDRLGRLLDRLSQQAAWESFELALGQLVVEVHRLKSLQEIKSEASDLLVVRADSFNAPQFRDPGDLFRFGYTKQRRKDQTQCKAMVAALDPIAIPMAINVVSGNGPDFEYYLPVMERTAQMLHTKGNLYVGDSQMGSMAIRSALQDRGDYYLSPLNFKQCTPQQLDDYLDRLSEQMIDLNYVQINRGKTTDESQNEEDRVYYTVVEESIEGEPKAKWIERRILHYSTPYGNRQRASYDDRLNRAEEKIKNLVVSKSGRRLPKTMAELYGRIAKVLQNYKLDPQSFEIKCQQHTKIRKIQRHKNRPERKEKTIQLSLKIKRNQAVIDTKRRKLGWRVYATNVPQQIVATEELIRCYRNEYRIEHLFDYVINRDTGLLPLYLKKEKRVKGLIRLLFVAMRLSVAVQSNIRNHLNTEQTTISGIYPGNKGRKTNRPTTPMLLRAMKGISVVFLNTSENPAQKVMTSQLNQLQQRIARMLDANRQYDRVQQLLKTYPNLRET